VASRGLGVLDIMKHLERSNCKECGVPTCMAFAALVVQGEKKLEDCPRLGDDSLNQLASQIKPIDEDNLSPEDAVETFNQEIGKIDFARAAERTGATLQNDRLSIRCLGKLFELDKKGDLHTLCHINPWVHGSILSYVTNCKGRQATREWVRFEQLRDATDWARFFNYRCERAFQQLAEENPETMLDILSLFTSSTSLDEELGDYTFEMLPLPKVPIRFRYQAAEEGIPASLVILFDRAVEDNLPAESLYILIRGLVEMFTQILRKHSDKT